MKKIYFLAALLVFASGFAVAQRFAVVDTRYIFEKMPEYKTVLKQIEDQAAVWQKELDTKQSALDKMYAEYDDNTTSSERQKKLAEDALFEKEKELRELQKKRFGFEGDLFKKRQELMEPLQKKLTAAINRIAIANAYDLVLDKSEGKTIIFADPKLDKSDDVLRELRLK